jgi:hypothetical protein
VNQDKRAGKPSSESVAQARTVRRIMQRGDLACPATHDLLSEATGFEWMGTGL